VAPRRRCARPHKRYGHWYLVRRVPRQSSAYDARNPVMLSTGIRIADDPRAVVAGTAVQKLDQGLERYWRERSAGRDVDAVARYEHTLEAARKIGVSYVPAGALATSPIEHIVQRFELLQDSNAIEKPVEVSAVLGGGDVPPLMLSQIMDEFQRISEASLAGESQPQKKRWRTPARSVCRPPRHQPPEPALAGHLTPRRKVLVLPSLA
jgi:hypothetical protein